MTNLHGIHVIDTGCAPAPGRGLSGGRARPRRLHRLRRQPFGATPAGGPGPMWPGAGRRGLADPDARAPGSRRRRGRVDAAIAQCPSGGAPTRCAAHDRPQPVRAGATAVYGEAEMQRSYGQLVPVAAERVVEAPDGHAVELAAPAPGVPGHARPCAAPQRHLRRGLGRVFSGDTLACPTASSTPRRARSSRRLRHQRVRSAWRCIVHRPAGGAAARRHLSDAHFGRLEPVQRLAAQLHEQIDARWRSRRRRLRGGDSPRRPARRPAAALRRPRAAPRPGRAARMKPRDR